MDAIKIENLVKKYGKVKAVNNISLEVKRGECFAFLGVNGAGKSTTISVICGLNQKDSGKVFINDVDIDANPSLIKKNIGVVFQNSVLDKKLTVYENLKSRASLYGIFGGAFDERLKTITRFLKLDDILNCSIEKLSGGQRRRADIARAIIHNPEILILDEPTTGLDPATRKLVWKSINEMREKNNLTVFLTTHYMEEAATADHITIIDKGKIIASGTPLELKNKFTNDTLYLYNVELNDVKKIGLKYKKIPEGYALELPSLSFITKMVTEFPELFTDFEVIKGQMDDVFINATGREEEK